VAWKQEYRRRHVGCQQEIGLGTEGGKANLERKKEKAREADPSNCVLRPCKPGKNKGARDFAWDNRPVGCERLSQCPGTRDVAQNLEPGFVTLKLVTQVAQKKAARKDRLLWMEWIAIV